MRLNKQEREFIAEGLAGVTFYEKERVIDGSAFTESGCTPSGHGKAEYAKEIKEDAEKRLPFLHNETGYHYERVLGYIKQLDEFIAANTPAEVG